MKNFINVVCVIGGILLFWIFASWIDINNHNGVFSEDFGDYASWNFFIVWGEILED